MLGGHFIAPTLVLHQELFQATGGEREGLAPQLHQIGILKPRVGKAILDSGSAPARPRKAGKRPSFSLLYHLPNNGEKLGKAWLGA